jgi:hypothetical protein
VGGVFAFGQFKSQFRSARLGLSFSISFAFALHANEARHAGNASLAGIEGLRRLALIGWLADGLREEHDEAVDSKPAFTGGHPCRFRTQGSDFQNGGGI